VQRKPAAFTKEQFVFVSVNYRFVPQVTLKEMTGDIAKAIKWIHDHAKDFGGDPNVIFVGGHSAGAHLAALVCTDERYLQAEGLTLANIKGCIPVDTAAYDIPKRVADAKSVPEKATEVFGKDDDSHKELSPITYISKDKNIPPFCLLHVADRPDSTAQSKAFAQALQDAGIEATVVSGEGKTHGTINSDLGVKGDKPTEALFNFLDKALKKTQ
jgi:acetyl esterase/lipase